MRRAMSPLDEYHRHEVLHMASFLADSVEDQLVVHPAIRSNKEWLSLARKAANSLSDLYQKIGEVHFGTPGELVRNDRSVIPAEPVENESTK